MLACSYGMTDLSLQSETASRPEVCNFRRRAAAASCRADSADRRLEGINHGLSRANIHRSSSGCVGIESNSAASTLREMACLIPAQLCFILHHLSR